MDESNFSKHPNDLFDRIVQIAQLDLLPRGVNDLVKRARLFWHPWKPISNFEFLLKMQMENPELSGEQFFLPFPVTAMLDTCGFTIFADTIQNIRLGQRTKDSF